MVTPRLVSPGPAVDGEPFSVFVFTPVGLLQCVVNLTADLFYSRVDPQLVRFTAL